MRLLAAIFAALVAGMACACAQPKVQPHGWRAITLVVEDEPISTTGETRFGDLIFRGGLELSSDDEAFGGWSGLEVDEAGRLVAVSDKGVWLVAQIETGEDGALTGVSDARLSLMRDSEGVVISEKDDADAEGLTRLDDGRYAVSFERRHRIMIFDLDGAGPLAPATLGPAAPAAKLKENEGLEALALGPKGELIAGSEFAPPGEERSRFYRIKLSGEDAPVEGPATTMQGYALVGLDRLPDGDYVALERFFFPIIGVRTTIRRYAAAGLDAETAVLDGPVLAAFAPPLVIDNFEAIAAVPLKDGTTRLYIMSDDNFSDEQRTLLYAFDVAKAEKEEEPAKP